jgi:hypothetical protein
MREDLVALTPEAVAALSNVGLVKRALREIEQGKGPTLEEDSDGAVTGHFDDGVVARLTRGRVLRDCTCSCNAAGVCRHRVATALAYRVFAATSPASSNALAPQEPDAPSWSPGAIDDAAIETLLGRRTMEEARGAQRRGVIIEVIRGLGSEPPTARLPSCTVRFLVPNDLVYARCDCAIGQRCAHVALAAWAFRRADATDAAARTLAVELRDAAPATRDDDAGAAAVALVLDVIAGGFVHAREALAQRFVLARESLEAAGQRWRVDALDELELTLARYRARSARYRAEDALRACAEIVARGRAAVCGGALPVGAVLGRGEAMETKLDHVRLVGLGCRFEADGESRTAEVLLADPDTATVLVLEKSWSFGVGETVPEAPALARRKLGTGSVAQLASGQLVTRVARRRANRALVLGASTHGATSVVPQTGDLSILPAPVRIERLTELDALRASRAPRLLRPRVLAEDVHAIAVTAVQDVVFDPAEQALLGRARDQEGASFLVRRGHRKAAPSALDVLARALVGQQGRVRWIVGAVRRASDSYVIEPTMVVADRVIVPDVEESSPFDVPRGHAPSAVGPLDRALAAAQSLLEEAVQLGVSGVPSSFDDRTTHAVEQLRQLGIGSLAAHIERTRDAIRRVRAGDGAASADAAAAIVDAAIRLELVREARAGEE